VVDLTKAIRLLAQILLQVRRQKTMKTMSEESRARQMFPADNQCREPISVPDADAEELSSFTERALSCGVAIVHFGSYLPDGTGAGTSGAGIGDPIRVSPSHRKSQRCSN
jgi:hypothetical protein